MDLKKEFISGGLKTDAGKGRIIPIHPKIMPFIQKWYAKNGEALICKENGKQISAKYYREKYYYPALEQINIKKRTPHTCRHTFGSLMGRANADPKRIQEIIGHASYAFTKDIYTHPEIEELKREIRKI